MFERTRDTENWGNVAENEVVHHRNMIYEPIKI